VSPLPFADPLSIGEAPHHFESHPGSICDLDNPDIAKYLMKRKRNLANGELRAFFQRFRGFADHERGSPDD
jgi:hypothetical protein